MTAEIIEFRAADGLTDAEFNEMKAALRAVMPVLCGLEAGRAEIITQRNEDGTSYVSALTDAGAWTLCREANRYALIDPNFDTVAEAGRLEDLLSSVR